MWRVPPVTAIVMAIQSTAVNESERINETVRHGG
jgi:hypothetical protein